MQENSIMTITDFNIGEMTPAAASAIEMHNNIISSMQTAAEAMVTLCINLKKMRDTQSYRAIGFEKFEDYTEQACNLKKRQAYNYIQTYERLGSTILQSNAQLGITKLQLLAEVSAIDRAEFAEENDLEGISVAEMKKLVAQTKEQAEQIDLLRSAEKLSSKTISQLEKENRELRSRPTEVAVQEPSEQEIAAALAERTKKLEEQHAAQIKELESDHKQKLKKARDKAKEKAEADRKKAVDEAKAQARAEAEQSYKDKLSALEAEKAEAEKKAKAFAERLDKNADADLVKASTYFAEAQGNFDNFIRLTDKIGQTDNEKASKLKSAAVKLLTQLMETLQ